MQMMTEGTSSAARSTSAGALARRARAMKMQTMLTIRPRPDRNSGSVTAREIASTPDGRFVNRLATNALSAVIAIAMAATIAATRDS